jgi:hypothetical protein
LAPSSHYSQMFTIRKSHYFSKSEKSLLKSVFSYLGSKLWKTTSRERGQQFDLWLFVERWNSYPSYPPYRPAPASFITVPHHSDLLFQKYECNNVIYRELKVIRSHLHMQPVAYDSSVVNGLNGWISTFAGEDVCG